MQYRTSGESKHPAYTNRMARVSAVFYRFAEQQQQQNGVGRTNQGLLRAQEAAEKMKNSVRSLSKNHQVVLLNESVHAIFFSWQ